MFKDRKVAGSATYKHLNQYEVVLYYEVTKRMSLFIYSVCSL